LVAEYRDKDASLSASIDERKLQWSKEDAAHAKALSERNAELEKNRKREQADYEYNRAQEAKLAKAGLEEELRKIARINQDKQENLERDWSSRESKIKLAEDELASLRGQVAAFPEVQKKEVARAEAIIANTLNGKFTTEKTLLQKDMDTNARILTQEKMALAATVEQQKHQIQELQAQLDKAKESSQSVVLKALDSASGRATLEQITSMQNSKNDGAATKSKS
jgi:hypothetical protein